MTDIKALIARLKNPHHEVVLQVATEAADALEALEKENERLNSGLQEVINQRTAALNSDHERFEEIGRLKAELATFKSANALLNKQYNTWRAGYYEKETALEALRKEIGALEASLMGALAEARKELAEEKRKNVVPIGVNEDGGG